MSATQKENKTVVDFRNGSGSSELLELLFKLYKENDGNLANMAEFFRAAEDITLTYNKLVRDRANIGYVVEGYRILFAHDLGDSVVYEAVFPMNSDYDIWFEDTKRHLQTCWDLVVCIEMTVSSAKVEIVKS